MVKLLYITTVTTTVIQNEMTLHHKSKIGGIVGRQAFDLSRKEIANIESQCPLNWEST